MRYGKICGVLASGAILAGISSTDAAISFGDVLTEATVGSGANETMIVFDWKSGSTPSHAWLYKYDGSKTLADAMNAIETASSNFDWSETAFVTKLDYFDGSESHVGNSAGWMSFWGSSDGENWSSTPVGVMDYDLIDGGFAGGNPDVFGNWPGASPVVPLVPEPASVALLGLGGLALLKRRVVEQA